MLRCRFALVYLSISCAISVHVRHKKLHAPYAVVRPFYDGDLPVIRDFYGDPSRPRACANHTLPVDLILYYAGSEATASNLSEVLDTAAQDSCFRQFHLKYANLSDDMKYPEAPCRQFVSMYQQEPPIWGYDAMFMMEIDMHPMKPGWLEDILPLLDEAAKGDVWMAGGKYTPTCMYEAAESPRTEEPWIQEFPYRSARSDGHINGNAVYTAVPEWTRIVRKHVDRCPDEGGWDYWLFERYKSTTAPAKWRSDRRFMDCNSADKNSVTKPFGRIKELNPQVLFIHANPDLEWLRASTGMDMYRKVSNKNRRNEIAVFWHIPRSAGATIEFQFRDRYNFTQLVWHRLHDETEWYVRRPGTPVLSRGGMQNIHDGEINMITTRSLNALRSTLNIGTKGRLITIVRHPVHRFVSEFYFLQRVERTTLVKPYRSLEAFVESDQMEEDLMCSQLGDLMQREPHVETAKALLREYFVVGLFDQLPESMRRFRIYLNVSSPAKFVEAHRPAHRRSGAYKKLQPTDPLYGKIAEKLSYDMEFYEEARRVFDDQAARFPKTPTWEGKPGWQDELADSSLGRQ